MSAAITELVEVYDLKEERNDDINELRVGESDEWRDFMVGGGPDKHWIYELHE